jgi:hypothetical protein
MALERIARKPAGEKAGLKKLEAGGVAKRRTLSSALDFMRSEDDVLTDMPEPPNHIRRGSWLDFRARSGRAHQTSPTCLLSRVMTAQLLVQ